MEEPQKTAAGNLPPPSPAERRPLWAPWRIKYIRAPKSTGCFFCRKGKTPERDRENHVLARGRHCFVLLNDFPYNSGHLLIAPYRHVGDLDALILEEMTEIMRLAARCEQALKHLMHPDGFNFGFNIGAAAGAGVKDHIHAHLVPRWVGDTNFMPVLADARVVPEALDQTARAIRQTWQKLFEE